MLFPRWYQLKTDWRVWLHSRRRGVPSSKGSESTLLPETICLQLSYCATASNIFRGETVHIKTLTSTAPWGRLWLWDSGLMLAGVFKHQVAECVKHHAGLQVNTVMLTKCSRRLTILKHLQSLTWITYNDNCFLQSDWQLVSNFSLLH